MFAPTDSHEVTEARLSGPTDIAGFRTQTRHLLGNQVPPEQVRWSAPAADAATPVDAGAAEASRPHGAGRVASSIVPTSFVRLCEYVVQHRDADRFELLYRLLWRLVHEPGLRHDPADADMARSHHMAHAVRRDIHKIKANVRFRPVHDPRRPALPLHLAWCEPAHHIMDTVAPWFARRYPDIRWALLAPERSVEWDGTQLRFARGSSPALSATAPDSEWLARWHCLFDDGA